MCNPRLRSKAQVWGFNPHDPETAWGDKLAMRAAFLFHLCAAYGLLGSAEQPSASIMFRLDIFRRLLNKGYKEVIFPFCNFGTPFLRCSAWICNNPALLQLRSECTCPLESRHLRLESTFTREGLKQFTTLCRPDVFTVFGRIPSVGERLNQVTNAYPLPLCRKLLELQRPAILQLQHSAGSYSRPHEPPRWVADLGRSLHWRKLFQYRSNRANHINVNEELSYRSLVKYAAKTSPCHRFPVMLDAGCNQVQFQGTL